MHGRGVAPAASTGSPIQWGRPPAHPQFPGAPERSIEDLKARYYSVARQLLVGREGGPESVANNTLVRWGLGGVGAWGGWAGGRLLCAGLDACLPVGRLPHPAARPATAPRRCATRTTRSTRRSGSGGWSC